MHKFISSASTICSLVCGCAYYYPLFCTLPCLWHTKGTVSVLPYDCIWHLRDTHERNKKPCTFPFLYVLTQVTWTIWASVCAYATLLYSSFLYISYCSSYRWTKEEEIIKKETGLIREGQNQRQRYSNNKISISLPKSCIFCLGNCYVYLQWLDWVT